jgi:hypothetical protein
MMRLGHQAAAQTTWLGYCTWLTMHGQPMDWREVACGAVVASSMCADDWSPDVDQGGWLAKVIPGGHRGITHTPEIVAVLLWLVHYALAGRGYDWFPRGATAAWGSHLAVDFICGRIPFLILGGRRIGLGLRTGGLGEAALTWLMTVACLPLAWVALGGPLP